MFESQSQYLIFAQNNYSIDLVRRVIFRIFAHHL